MENNIWNLIEKIAPLFNKYKQNKDVLSWSESISLMWDIWLILNEYLLNNTLSPTTLSRKIYWKSEW